VRLRTALFLTVLIPLAAFAGHLQPLQVLLPADPGLVRHKCAEAFQQALEDKAEYESQPQVHIKCAYNISFETKAQMEDKFLYQCQNTVSVRSSSGLSDPNLIIPEDILAGSFNDAYGVIFRRNCLDTAKNEFDISQAQAAASGGTGYGGGAVSERCAFHYGCR
jgi:hypothetical protein